jgi:hypothetical protein
MFAAATDNSGPEPNVVSCADHLSHSLDAQRQLVVAFPAAEWLDWWSFR